MLIFEGGNPRNSFLKVSGNKNLVKGVGGGGGGFNGNGSHLSPAPVSWLLKLPDLTVCAFKM